MTLTLKVRRVDWPLKTPFRIAYEEIRSIDTVLVELHDGVAVGRGEAAGVSYRGETVETMLRQIADLRPAIESGLPRAVLQGVMPPGGARNAIDCAMWDLEAKRAGRRAWELAGLAAPRPRETFFTLGVDEPAAMARAAREAMAQGWHWLKLKLMGTNDRARVAAVRQTAPEARLIVDANQSWAARDLHANVAAMAEFGVELIEQPLPMNADDALRGFVSAVPLCADESCQTVESLLDLRGKYAVVNIKLDKTGGLTGALRLAEAAKRQGFGLMVGNMCGSSLAMAPAFLIAQGCDFVDLDGPLLNLADWPQTMMGTANWLNPPVPELWG